jgi:MFS transporter, MHS family, proline/betaine transporter
MPKNSLKIVVLAGLLGEIVEWYDFVIYGFFATTLAKLFFSSLSNT